MMYVPMRSKPYGFWGSRVGALSGAAGFSLVELCVVMCIIVILSAMLLPAIQTVKQLVKNAKCGNNQRQIAVALLVYAEDNEGTFPYALDSRVSKIYDSYLDDYLPRVSTYGQHQIAGRMYDCPSITYDYTSSGYKTKGPDYGLNSAIAPRYSAGVSEGRVSRISRSSEVVLLGDASAGMGMGLTAGSYYMLVTPVWLASRQRSPWSSFPCARHPTPSDLTDAGDGISVGGTIFIGTMADGRVAQLSINSPEFASPVGRQRTFTQP